MDLSHLRAFVGYQVEIETNTEKIQATVRSVDKTGSKLSLVNAILDSSKQLPSLYHVYVKDIKSIYRLSTSNSQSILGQSDSPPKTNGIPLVKPKILPNHLKSINNEIDIDILVNRAPQQSAEKKSYDDKLPSYTIVDGINDIYFQSVDMIKKQKIIGVTMEGVDVGRFGVICWIGMSIENHVYLFDMCSLGSPGMKHGLAEIYEDPSIVKVVHDCRFMSDALCHLYKVQMVNIFDTQVAAATVDFQTNGLFPRYVQPLTMCLNIYLGLPKEIMFHPRTREGSAQEDESRWRQRPLPDHLVRGAIFNAFYLRRLRLALMEKLLSVVERGTQLYLEEICELPDEAVPGKMAVSHFIPKSFETFMSTSTTSRHRNDVCFSPGVSNGCDPYISFTRDVAHLKKN